MSGVVVDQVAEIGEEEVFVVSRKAAVSQCWVSPSLSGVGELHC
jgi:hypothetical protein